MNVVDFTEPEDKEKYVVILYNEIIYIISKNDFCDLREFIRGRKSEIDKFFLLFEAGVLINVDYILSIAEREEEQ